MGSLTRSSRPDDKAYGTVVPLHGAPGQLPSRPEPTAWGGMRDRPHAWSWCPRSHLAPKQCHPPRPSPAPHTHLLRAVEAYTLSRSAIASATLSYTEAAWIRSAAWEAVASAPGLGQPSRGRTSRKSYSPKFFIARAAAPMFSAIWGSTRMTVGCNTGRRPKSSIAAAPRELWHCNMIYGYGTTTC